MFCVFAYSSAEIYFIPLISYNLVFVISFVCPLSNWKKSEMNEFRTWLKLNNYDWEDPKLALGYIKIGQVDMKLGFQNKPFIEVYNIMKNNLNISSIHIVGTQSWESQFPYTLENENWKQIQMNSLKKGYESHSLR